MKLSSSISPSTIVKTDSKFHFKLDLENAILLFTFERDKSIIKAQTGNHVKASNQGVIRSNLSAATY